MTCLTLNMQYVLSRMLNMAIEYVVGDLLSCTQPVLVHGCNNQGVMGSGVARQIRAKWPHVYEVYHKFDVDHGLELGDVIPAVAEEDLIVLNAITQDGFGRDGAVYVKYDAITTCFRTINVYMQHHGFLELALPRIGAGLGGGDWKIIEEIINQTAENYTPVVYDYSMPV